MNAANICPFSWTWTTHEWGFASIANCWKIIAYNGGLHWRLPSLWSINSGRGSHRFSSQFRYPIALHLLQVQSQCLSAWDAGYSSTGKSRRRFILNGKRILMSALVACLLFGGIGSIDPGMVVDMGKKWIGSFILRGLIEVDTCSIPNQVFIEPYLSQQAGTTGLLDLLAHFESARHGWMGTRVRELIL